MSFNRPAAPKNRSAAPRLWAEGRQQPPFDLRGLSRVALLLSRRMARPLLLGTARVFGGGAGWMAENTVGPRLARASRLCRALPPRDVLARGLGMAAELMTMAADLAVPPPVVAASPPSEPGRPVLIVRRPRRAELRLADPEPAPSELTPPEPAQPEPALLEPAQPAHPLRPTDDPELDAPTVAAIRAMIDEMRDVRPAKPVAPGRRVEAPPEPPSGRVLLTHGVPLTPAEVRPPTLGRRLAARAFRMTAGSVAGIVTVLALPAGLVRAVITHLHGNDLRTWS